MRRLLASASLVALLVPSGCRPIQTQHAFALEYPRERTDLTLRFLPAPSGHVALWISTSDDLEDNGRYEGVNVIVDPGSPEDVEAALLPALPDGLPVSYVVLTAPDPRGEAGARRLGKDHRVKEVVAPAAPRPGKTQADGGAFLRLGGELTARLVGPRDVKGIPARAFLLRFIDVQILALPSLDEGRDAWALALAEDLEKEGLHSTIVWSPEKLAADTVEALEVEAVVGPTDAAGALFFPVKEALTLGTNGSEIRAPGPLTRSRYGHWIDCRAKGAACAAELVTPASGPLRVTLSVAGETGTYLLDTRAPMSYLTRPVFAKIPGAEVEKGHAGHSHGGGAIGHEVPPFRLGDLEVRRWHVLPVEPFSVDGAPIAGVIGMDLLQSFEISWQPPERKLRLVPNFSPPRERLAPKAEAVEDGWRIPLDRSPAGPLILATLDGRPASLVVDLASEETAVYLRADEFAKVTGAKPSVRWYFDVPDDVDEATWTKKDLTTGTLRVKDLNLFGAHFTDTSALAVDRPLDADVLGLDFLRTFDRVSINFRERSLTLTR